MDRLLLIVCIVEVVQLILTFTLFKNNDEQDEINQIVLECVKEQNKINAKHETKLYEHTCDINFLKAKTHDKYTKGTLDE